MDGHIRCSSLMLEHEEHLTNGSPVKTVPLILSDLFRILVCGAVSHQNCSMSRMLKVYWIFFGMFIF
jgi:hypothetical protein